MGAPGSIWRCEDCGWRWPLADVPSQDSECDACGGEMTPETEQQIREAARALANLGAIIGGADPRKALRPGEFCGCPGDTHLSTCRAQADA